MDVRDHEEGAQASAAGEEEPAAVPSASYHKLNEEIEHLHAIYELSSAINQAAPLEHIYALALAFGRDILHAAGAALLLYGDEDEGTERRFVTHFGLSDDYLRVAAAHPYWPDETTGKAQAHLIADTDAMAAALDLPLHDAGIGALATFPLTSKERVLGAFAIYFRETHTFTTTGAEMGQAIAHHLAIAVKRNREEAILRATREEMEARVEKRMALLKEQIKRRKEAEAALQRESAYSHLLQKIAVAANEAESVRSVLQIALDEICAHMKWPLGHVYLVTEEGDLVSMGLWHCDGDQFREFTELTAESHFVLDQGWLGKVAGGGKAAWNRDVSQDPEFVRRSDDSDLGVRASFAFPVVVDGKVAVVLEFFSTDVTEPDGDFLKLVDHIATQIGRVIERKRAEERLQHSETMLAQAERLAHLGSWEWDANSGEVRWSAEMHRIYGLEPGTFSGEYEGFLARVHPDDRERVRRLIGEAYEEGRPFTFYHRIVRPDESERVLHAQGRPKQNETGAVVGMYGTGQDVTSQMKAQERLELNTRQLDALHEMGLAVTSTLDAQQVFDEVLNQLLPLLKAEGVFILLLDGDELVFTATKHPGEHDPSGHRVPATSGVAGDVLRTGRPIAITGAEAEERAFRDVLAATGNQLGALLVAPLQLRGTTIGVLEAIHRDIDGFEEEDLHLLEAAASWAAIAVQNARLFGEIRDSRERLRRLARQVVTAQEEERRRLARELHDQAGQALTALKMNLEMLNVALGPATADLQEELEEMILMADDTMEQIRRLTHGLRPPVLERFGLGPAVEGLCKELSTRSNLAVHCDITPLPTLADDVAISLYRVVQEATTNIVKHADAEAVQVRLDGEKKGLRLEIRDDGIGFSRAAVGATGDHGIGLDTMRERVELLGGTFSITSRPGEGTTITVRVPYARGETAL